MVMGDGPEFFIARASVVASPTRGGFGVTVRLWLAYGWVRTPIFIKTSAGDSQELTLSLPFRKTALLRKRKAHKHTYIILPKIGYFVQAKIVLSEIVILHSV